MKSKFVKSTIILLIGGLLTKILGMVIKMIETRLLGAEGIGLFMLISPTFNLLLTISQFGLPTSISTLVARDQYRSKHLILSVYPFMLGINVFLFLFLVLSGRFLSTSLLHDERLYHPLLCIGLVLPFITSSSLIRGYFFGKEKMVPHVLSNITEDLIRIVLFLFGIPYFLQFGLECTISFLILSNIISESVQMLTLFFFFPKKLIWKKEDFIPKKDYFQDVLSISIPTTGSRFIGSIGYFLEPIFLTSILLKSGYSNHFIVTEYGILEGYVLPLLMLPSFFTMAISQALIPVISKAFSKKQFSFAKNKLKQAVLFSLMIGIPITCFFFFFPNLPLNFLYHTNKGISYLKIISPFFLLLYIQTPFTATLQAMGKAKIAMKGTLFGMILRTTILCILSFFKIGLWGLVIAMITNIFFVTFYQGYHINKLFKSKKI